MIPIPNGRLIILFSLPIPFYVGSIVAAPLFYVAAGLNSVFLIIAMVDILSTMFNLQYQILSEPKKLFSIGRVNSFAINIINRTRKDRTALIRLGLPEEIEDRNEINSVKLKGLTENKIEFQLRPTRRGSFLIDALYIRTDSKYKLFYFDQKSKIDVTIDVYPDIKELNYYLKLTRNNRDYKMGINKTRWLGNGTELESLRDYQKDDDSKSIDWKASTRLNRPISKVFQMETNNQITIALDCGRLMTAEQNGINTLDHAINSLLILAHIAFNAGDSVSIVAFSDKIIGETMHLKGRDSIKKITQFISKLKPEFVESNYSLVFNYLEKTQKKRALIIVLTDMIDDINYELFKKRIHWLSRKHFLLLVLMQDSLLARHANQSLLNPEDLYLKAASREMSLQRHKAITKLKHYNINVLDVLPNELTGPLINTYLELKTRNRL